jgi:hypothetical protein
MAAVNKLDSNFTDLRFAAEDTPGHVPSDAVWYPLEPNSYKNFGAEVKLKARMPINSSRQLKKGVVVDLDAQGGWTQDLTQTNFQRLAPYFFWAAMRTKSELSVAAVDGTANAYQPSAGGTAYYAGDLLFAKDFADTANDGLKKVSGFPSVSNIAVTDTGLLTASTQTGIISRVGFEYSAGQVTIDISGTYPKLVVTNVAATGTLTSTGTLDDTETVTIGGVVYLIQAAFTAGAGHVKKGATAQATLKTLKNAINQTGGETGAVANTDYDAASTPANPYVTATSDATHLVVTARVGGAVGNAITTTDTLANASWGGLVLSGGTGGRAPDSFGFIPGELVFLGGDAAANQFFHAVDNGFCRVRSINSQYLEFDKTQHIMVADDGTDTGAGGTGQTIRIFFGRVIKNEADVTLIVKRSIQLERTLGQPDDASPATQAEYLLRGIADQMKLDSKTADIVRIELDFLCNTNELRTSAQGVKPGTRPSIADADAFNTTSDVAFTKLAIVTSANACPTPLLAFFTDLVLDLKNNLKQNKAVSVLGAFDSTAGFFQVGATLTGYFTDVAEMQAVKDNKSITLEQHFVKFNAGVSIDLPLLTLGKALADVKLNEPIMIPLQSDAATAKIIDPNLDYTMLWVFWDYLPTLAG